MPEVQLLQHAQHQRALGLAGAEGDLAPLDVLEPGNAGAWRRRDHINGMADGIAPELGGDDPDLEPGPLRMDRRDVGDGADVERLGPKGLDRLRAAGDIGPFDLEGQLGEFA